MFWCTASVSYTHLDVYKRQVGGPGEELPKEIAAPCGVCRQVLMEFCDAKELKVLLGKGDKTWQEYTLEELLPLGFSMTKTGQE